MPTYQYACTACDERLEAVQSFSDPALTECPVCGGRLRKVFSAVGVVFKGSGFYKTDSRGGESEKADAAASSDGGSTGSGSGKGGDGGGSAASGSGDAAASAGGASSGGSASGGTGSGSSGGGSGGAASGGSSGASPAKPVTAPASKSA